MALTAMRMRDRERGWGYEEVEKQVCLFIRLGYKKQQTPLLLPASIVVFVSPLFSSLSLSSIEH